MPIFYGVRELGRADHWREVVGGDKWVPGRSAYELAYKWQGCDGLPDRVKSVLSAAGEPFSRLIVRYGMVELPTLFGYTERAFAHRHNALLPYTKG